jgi:hypothetical protein
MCGIREGNAFKVHLGQSREQGLRFHAQGRRELAHKISGEHETRQAFKVFDLDSLEKTLRDSGPAGDSFEGQTLSNPLLPQRCADTGCTQTHTS